MANPLQIISGFPGIGKSHYQKNSGLRVTDSDSSHFPKADFPANYMRHIKSCIPRFDRIMVSMHADVRQALVDNQLAFTLVYPQANLKDLYLDRYRERGSPAAFVDMMASKWDDFIAECNAQEGCYKIRLGRDMYLADVL